MCGNSSISEYSDLYQPHRGAAVTEQTPDELVEPLAPRLALLAALGEHGNLTAAAAAAGIPQPTASRWLATLSTRTGMTLVMHQGRGMQLTRAGAELADAAATALTALRGGAARALAAADPERGHVVFAFLHTMGGIRVPRLLRGFRARHPRVGFTLTQAPHHDMLDKVRSGEVDLALTSPLPVRDAELDSVALFDDPLVLVVAADHRLATRDRIRLRSLADEPMVGLRAGYGLRQITDEMCARAGFVPRLVFEGEEVDTVRGLVAADLGVALLPAHEGGVLPGTAEIPVSPKAFRSIGLVTAAGAVPSPAAALFRDWCVTASRARP